jgi:hypothetical protein
LSDIKEQSYAKGNTFEKAQKMDIFVDNRKNPGPTYYFKTPTSSSEN